MVANHVDQDQTARVCKLISFWQYTQLYFNPFPHTCTFLRLYSRRSLKKLWQKEELLMINNFFILPQWLHLFFKTWLFYTEMFFIWGNISFCHTVFKKRLLQIFKEASVCGKMLSFKFADSCSFLCVCVTNNVKYIIYLKHLNLNGNVTPNSIPGRYIPKTIHL